MADWIQPASLIRQLDTGYSLQIGEMTFTANFAGYGYVRIDPAGGATWVSAEDGSSTPLPLVYATAALRPVDNDSGAPISYTDWLVKSISVNTLDGRYADVAITFSLKTAVTLRPSTTIEVVWVASQTPLVGHSRYADNLLSAHASVTIDGVTLDMTMGDIFRSWQTPKNDTARKAYYDAMDSLTAELADKFTNGETHYLTYHPVVRRTSGSAGEPTIGGAGGIDTPPATVPGTWEFLKTAAQKTWTGESGTWQSVEEWTGAASLDHNIYS